MPRLPSPSSLVSPVPQYSLQATGTTLYVDHSAINNLVYNSTFVAPMHCWPFQQSESVIHDHILVMGTKCLHYIYLHEYFF